MRLDIYDKMPSGLKEYLSYYGWHFNKKLCDFATSKMRGEDNKKIKLITKSELEQMMQDYNIEIKNSCGYDCLFVINMAKADFYGTTITDEKHLITFVKDYIDDPDGYEGLPMTRFFADVIGKGIVIDWEEML